MQCLRFVLVVITVGSVQLLNEQTQVFILNEDSEMKSWQRQLIILSMGDCSQTQTQYFRVVWGVSQMGIEVYI